MSQRPPGMQMVMPFTDTVKKLVIVTVGFWLVFQVILEQLLLPQLELSRYLGLVPAMITEHFYIWQLFTYMFLHSVEPTHIIFNMLMLWWLGSELEQMWGKKFFLFYYLMSGTGAAILYFLFSLVMWLVVGRVDNMVVPVVGASGAVFALLLAYGIIYGERVVYFMFVVPMKAKYFVMILGGIEFVLTINSGGLGKMANLVHLGGLLVGFIILYIRSKLQKSGTKRRGGSGPKLRLVVDNRQSNEDNGPRYWN